MKASVSDFIQTYRREVLVDSTANPADTQAAGSSGTTARPQTASAASCLQGRPKPPPVTSGNVKPIGLLGSTVTASANLGDPDDSSDRQNDPATPPRRIAGVAASGAALGAIALLGFLGGRRLIQRRRTTSPITRRRRGLVAALAAKRRRRGAHS